eukprot:4111617-Amphidinium_carterae.1
MSLNLQLPRGSYATQQHLCDAYGTSSGAFSSLGLGSAARGFSCARQRAHCRSCDCFGLRDLIAILRCGEVCAPLMETQKKRRWRCNDCSTKKEQSLHGQYQGSDCLGLQSIVESGSVFNL